MKKTLILIVVLAAGFGGAWYWREGSHLPRLLDISRTEARAEVTATPVRTDAAPIATVAPAQAPGSAADAAQAAAEDAIASADRAVGTAAQTKADLP